MPQQSTPSPFEKSNITFLFDTRNRKRACSTAFVVSAGSPGEAQAMAGRLLRQCGENPLHFKAPKTRPLTVEEQLAMAG